MQSENRDGLGIVEHALLDHEQRAAFFSRRRALFGGGARGALRPGRYLFPLDAVDIDLPEIAKKALKPTAVCIQTDRWRALPDGSREGDIRVETKGQPAEITGRTRLRPGADGTTEFEVTLELKVKVPIIGGKIANMMRGDAEKLMQDEFDWNDRRIAEVTGAG